MSVKSSDEIARGNLNILIQTAITQERERIIKLLEDAQVTEAELFDGRTIKVKSQSVRADLLIELIKGENQKDNETVVLLAEGENK